MRGSVIHISLTSAEVQRRNADLAEHGRGAGMSDMSDSEVQKENYQFPALPAKPPFPVTDNTGALQEPISLEYVQHVFEAFERREESLRMRLAAVNFHPQRCLNALHLDTQKSARAESMPPDTATDELDELDPVLGVRLLQRLDILQMENEDLGARIEELFHSTAHERIREQQAELEGTCHTYSQILINSFLHSIQP